MAGALWSLAADEANCHAIAECGGIGPLVGLLKPGAQGEGAQETAAGALHALAKATANRYAIAEVCTRTELSKHLSAVFALRDSTCLEPRTLHERHDCQVIFLTTKYTICMICGQVDGIRLLVALLEGGSMAAKEQAAGALQTLALNNAPNQLAIATVKS